MLDLDKAIQAHPDFDLDAPRDVYSKREACEWADERVEAMYEAALRRGAGGSAPTALSPRICVDGTGTNVQRQLRRMRRAREAGFWVVMVYVRVEEAVIFKRNAQRKRRVPKAVIIDYLGRLSAAVLEVLDAGLVDEFISLDNSADDAFRSEEERWGQSRAQVDRASQTNRSIFDDSG